MRLSNPSSRFRHFSRVQAGRPSARSGERPLSPCSARPCEVEPLERRLMLDGTSYVVTSLSDLVASDGVVTLREAIQAANSNAAVTEDVQPGSAAEEDVITFDASLAGGTIVLGGTELAISDDLAIRGPGPDEMRITVDADGASRVFSVASGATVTMEDLLITGGALPDDGGGGIRNSGALTLIDSVVSGNLAESGGGVLSFGALTVIESVVSGNHAWGYGGGIYSLGTTALVNSALSGNYAYSGGGLTNRGDATLTGAVVSGNRAGFGGGSGIYNTYFGSLALNNSTVAGNSTEEFFSSFRRSGIFSISDFLTLNNTIVALNDFAGSPDVQGAYTGSNNLVGEDPGFVRAPSLGEDGVWGSEDDDPGDLRLVFPTSPAIDAGDNALLPPDQFDFDHDGNTAEPLPVDIAGNDRVVDGNGDSVAVVDIGALEHVPSPVSFVVNSLADTVASDGVVTLREAMEAANTNVAVTADVPAGSETDPDIITFAPSLAGGKIVLTEGQLEITDSVKILGPGPDDMRSTIDAAGTSRVFSVASETTVSMEDLIITGGAVANDDGGGGVYSDGTLTLTRCSILGNSAGGYAGWGGGICSDEHGSLTLVGSKVQGNSADDDGGGVLSAGPSLTIENSMILGNSVTSTYARGGGVYTRSANARIVNSAIAGNTAAYLGGGVYTRSGSVTITNSTLAANSVWDTFAQAGGIYNDEATLALHNTTLAQHRAPGEPEIVGPFTAENSLIGVDVGFLRDPSPGTDDQWGTADDDYGDLRLDGSSIAVDLGDNALAVDGHGVPLTTDLVGKPRIVHGRVDIGAYEYQGELPELRESPAAVVTTTTDVVDTLDGQISLREACIYGGILDEEVTFASALAGERFLLNGQELLLTEDLNIDASAAGGVTIDAQGDSRVIQVAGTASASLNAVTLINGSVRNGGGAGIHVPFGALTLANSVMVGNDGNAVYSLEGNVLVTNSTIAGNWSSVVGGAIHNTSGTSIVRNSIVALNGLRVDGLQISGNYTIQNSLVGVSPGFVREPSFGPDRRWATEDDDLGDLRLTESSLAVNLGDNSLAVGPEGLPLLTDQQGQPRIVHGKVDAGAYEYQGPASPTWESPSTLVTTLTDVVDKTDQEVSLREAIAYAGVTTETIAFDPILGGGAIALNGRELYVPYSLSIDAFPIGGIVIDAGGQSRVMQISGPQAEASLSGLTLTNGSHGWAGGAIRNYGSTLVLTSCVVSDSTAFLAGGIKNQDGTLTVANSVVSNNHASHYGGGIENDRGTMALENSTVAGNSARTSGGGIMSISSSVDPFSGTLTLSNSIVTMNHADRDPDLFAAELNGSHNLIGEDPGFVRNPSAGDDGYWGTEDDDPGDLHLASFASPAVDAGDNALIPPDTADLDGDLNTTEPVPFDLDGNPRVVDGNLDSIAVVDIGAYEFEWSTTFVVNSLADVVASDGVVTLREAIEAANTNSAVTADVPAGSFLGMDRITFDRPALQAEAGQGNPLVIALNGTELLVSDEVEIRGLGEDVLTIDAQELSRLLRIARDTGEVFLSGLTLTGGYHQGPGGGAIEKFQSSLTMIDCTISESTTTDIGGGIHNNGGPLVLINTTVAGNDARLNGGGISNAGGQITAVNSVVSGNSARTGGGFHLELGELSLTSSTVAGNWAQTEGGGIAGDSAELWVTMANTIVARNYAPIGTDVHGRFVSENSLVSIDPGFVMDPSPGPDGTWGTQDDEAGNVHLSERSLAINLGDDSLAVDTNGVPLMRDRDGNPRVVHGRVDIGAYEYQGEASALWDAPAPIVTTLADVVDITDGEVSLREACVYGAFLAEEVTFLPSLLGGKIVLAEGALYLHDPVVVDATPIGSLAIDGALQNRVVYVAGESSVVLNGLALTRGRTVLDLERGGGIYVDYSNLTMNHSVVANCETLGDSAHGGGLYNDHGTVSLRNTTVSGNRVVDPGSLGGGICTVSGAMGLFDSTVSDNAGGGIYAYGPLTVSSSTVSRNTGVGILQDAGSLTVIQSGILGNSSSEQGGGIQITTYRVPITIVNSLIAGNSASQGGGIYSYTDDPMLINTTVVGNTADSGGGIFSAEGEMVLQNTIVALNSSPDGDIYGEFTSDSSLIGADPGFVRDPSPGADGVWGTADDDYGDLRLQATSPAVDAGNTALLPADEFDLDGDGNTAERLPVDLAGEQRVQGASVDIGAYEFAASSVVVGRHVFYHDSYLDGFGASPGEAIDASKEALLPGETPGPDNWTAYSRGVNGVIVDVSGLPDSVQLTNDDFEMLRSDGDSWAPGPDPWAIFVHQGQGSGGSDRVVLVWSSLAVTDGWLAVRMLPTQRTALGIADVFAFGNLAGDANGDGSVNDADYTLWADHYGQTEETGTTTGDLNLDGKVTDADYTAWAGNYGDALAPPPALEAIETATAAPLVGAIAVEETPATQVVDRHQEAGLGDARPTGSVEAQSAVGASPVVEQPTISEPKVGRKVVRMQAKAETEARVSVSAGSVRARRTMGPQPFREPAPADVITRPGEYSLHGNTVGNQDAEESTDLLALLSLPRL